MLRNLKPHGRLWKLLEEKGAPLCAEDATLVMEVVDHEEEPIAAKGEVVVVSPASAVDKDGALKIIQIKGGYTILNPDEEQPDAEGAARLVRVVGRVESVICASAPSGKKPRNEAKPKREPSVADALWGEAFSRLRGKPSLS